MNRGDVRDAELPGAGRHPVVVVTRNAAIPVLTSVVVVMVTSTIRGLPSEVPLGPVQGLSRDCVANCDNLFTVPKRALGHVRGSLGPTELRRLNDALRLALELERTT